MLIIETARIVINYFSRILQILDLVMTSLPSSPYLIPRTANINGTSQQNEDATVILNPKTAPATPTGKINRVLKRMGNWITKKTRDENYKIEYSILQPPNGIVPILESQYISEFNLSKRKQDNYLSVIQFNQLVNDIISHIDLEGCRPVRISRGSSGSYFIKNGSGQIVGVFKPKNEEPYGKYQPKWGKWLQKNILGLLGFNQWFGRLCLINNQGYISEAMTSYIDQRLLSFIVPYTDIIYLKSEDFYYGWNKVDWKIGSFQKFLMGYQEANDWLMENPIPLDKTFQDFPKDCIISIGQPLRFYWNQRSLHEFIIELERLVILDYLIRNTDRSLDNWMIKLEWIEKDETYVPRIRVGAIDSGLSFPWKHPNEWRSFPYGWMQLPTILIHQPFDEGIRTHYLSILSSREWWETTIIGLKKVYKKTKDYQIKNWRYQLSVIKGQAFNILKVLSIANSTPLDLVSQPYVRIIDDYMKIPKKIDNSVIYRAINSSIHDRGEEQADPEDVIPKNPFTDEEHAIANELETVVIERMDAITEKSPVFTCC